MFDDVKKTTDELARVSAELEVMQRRLKLTLDAAGATCGWEWDIAAKRLVADAHFAAITNQDPAALADGVSTDCFFASVHPDDLKRVKIAVAGILAGSEVFSKDYRLLRPDGGYRWVHASGRAILDFELRSQPVGSALSNTSSATALSAFRTSSVIFSVCIRQSCCRSGR